VTYIVHRRSLTVEWGHCDPAGIVFNSRYFEYFDWSTGLMFNAALGMSKFDMTRAFEADMPLVDARATFHLPSHFGDVVEIETNVGEFRRSSFDIQHRLYNAGKLAVEGQETRVWIGRDKDNPSIMKSKPIPAEIVDRFKAH
jgi:4-hydroxybenzoyl-CoA thioesterase